MSARAIGKGIEHNVVEYASLRMNKDKDKTLNLDKILAISYSYFQAFNNNVQTTTGIYVSDEIECWAYVNDDKYIPVVCKKSDFRLSVKIPLFTSKAITHYNLQIESSKSFFHF